tara:strand:+ start:2646 stop:2792 length:147 start_codon:yes stop_codon:yes gene_type:complete
MVLRLPLGGSSTYHQALAYQPPKKTEHIIITAEVSKKTLDEKALLLIF